MTIPTVGDDTHVVMTLIAEFGLIRMAFHTGHLQALVIDLAVGGGVVTLTVTNDALPPLVEEAHV